MGAAETVRRALLLPLLLPACALAAAAAPDRFADEFERGLCLGGCRGWNWAASQEIDGRLAVAGGRLRAETGPRGQRVPKAALIARPAKLPPGARARIAFSLMVPHGAPLNSVHLLDMECASCGESGNPGIRLYLRHGRLRIDRAKIGASHAWTNDAAPRLENGRWHRIDLDVTAGFGAAGTLRARLDGRTVLDESGDTILRPTGAAAAGFDRIQIGITASSNPVPAAAFFDDVSVEIGR